MKRIAILAASVALALTACGSGEAPRPVSPGTTGANGQASVTAKLPPTTQPATPPPAGSGDGDQPAPPAPGQCVLVPAARDGVYTVFDAGTAVVRREGDRLVLGEIRPNPGWTSRVDDDGGEEVEIDFRRGGEDVLDLEVEIDDGRVEAEICGDDD